MVLTGAGGSGRANALIGTRAAVAGMDDIALLVAGTEVTLSLVPVDESIEVADRVFECLHSQSMKYTIYEAGHKQIL